MYYLSIICARRSIYIANPVLPAGRSGDRRADRGEAAAAWTCGSWCRGIHNDNWLARQNSVRLFGPLLRGGHRDPRIQPHDAPPQDDGGRRRVGDGRHDELRQPIVRAQRREQRLLLRSRRSRDQLHEMFEADIAACDRVELAAWKRRGLWQRTQEVFAAFLEEQT